jgi:anti-sigma factor ChrR (cupin superfamily)
VHGGVEWALVLEGTMEDEEGVVSAGNFASAPSFPAGPSSRMKL